MGWLRRTFTSSIGRKYVVSITGLLLVLFTIGHLSGNLLVFAGPEAINGYARSLRTYPALLWTARIGLLVVVALHIYYSIKLNLENKRARPQDYKSKAYQKATWASRHMVITGLLVLAYIFYHLAHFTFRVTSEEIGQYGHYDVYDMMIAAFQSPLVSITYIAAMVLLGFHLAHGISSMTQSVGLNHPKYNPFLRKLGPVAGFLLAAGYITIPVAIWTGLVG